jgi:hypothetical protein
LARRKVFCRASCHGAPLRRSRRGLIALAIDFWSLLSRRISDARLFIDGTESPQIAEAIEKV